MEKSGKVILSEQEKADLLSSGLTKSASESEEDVPERFKGWYSRSELIEIARSQK